MFSSVRLTWRVDDTDRRKESPGLLDDVNLGLYLSMLSMVIMSVSSVSPVARELPRREVREGRAVGMMGLNPLDGISDSWYRRSSSWGGGGGGVAPGRAKLGAGTWWIPALENLGVLAVLIGVGKEDACDWDECELDERANTSDEDDMGDEAANKSGSLALIATDMEIRRKPFEW